VSIRQRREGLVARTSNCPSTAPVEAYSLRSPRSPSDAPERRSLRVGLQVVVQEVVPASGAGGAALGGVESVSAINSPLKTSGLAENTHVHVYFM